MPKFIPTRTLATHISSAVRETDLCDVSLYLDETNMLFNGDLLEKFEAPENCFVRILLFVEFWFTKFEITFVCFDKTELLVDELLVVKFERFPDF